TTQKHYLHNCTFAKREDGSFLMVNRHGHVWFGEDGLSKFHRVSPARVYPLAEGAYEDPCVWRTNVQYHLIVNDWKGRIAWHLRSKDGVSWKVDSGEAYMPGISVHETGIQEDWFKYERVKVLQDQHGRAYAANFAVIDALKHSDLANDNHSSKLITVPMVKGRLLIVENEMALGLDTKEIRVRVQAEPGFDPHHDIDMEATRFGAPEEVDFGRGCKILSSHADGKDLILVFDGEGNGFSDHNFAGKLIGKDSDGKLLFGYCRLPEVNYAPPILSSRLPVVAKLDGQQVLNVEVRNLGQSMASGGTVSVLVAHDGGWSEIGSGNVPDLRPFESAMLSMSATERVPVGRHCRVMIRTECPGGETEELAREISF
ncbi:MAG: hypothetical protein AAF989_13695, partial [Planctomycetota bacterium]